MALNEDKIVLTGDVTNVYPGMKFEVTTEHGQKVICVLSGKLKVHQIRVLNGDRVDIEVSAYDITKGRIIWRHR